LTWINKFRVAASYLLNVAQATGPGERMNAVPSDPPGHRLRVLFVASELFPLAKTGGLGDACAALPAALRRLGTDIRAMLPGYVSALDTACDKRTLAHLPDGGALLLGRTPDTGLPVYLLDRPELFRRPGGPYQDADKCDWPDNLRRFAAFSHAAAHLARDGDGWGWQPDVVHAHDWHTGLVPALLALQGDRRPATVFTIHNLAFQGNFPLEAARELGLPEALLVPDGAEFYGQFSCLKAGIRYADRLTTVSPTYAREILTPEFGAGMDGLLRARAGDLVGILNGIDNALWNPADDPALPARYDAEDLGGKRAAKDAVRQELGLDPAAEGPLVVGVNRLTRQKMADVVLQALPALLDQGAQVALHGEGDPELEAAFLAAAAGRAAHCAVRIGYSEAMAHRLNAAADIALTPSRFEPCGLTTMYAMRYGALPLTRKVGGLADSVTEIDTAHPETTAGTGFTFAEPTAEALADGLHRAGTLFRQPHAWQRLQRNAMRRDFGWEVSARRYLALYGDLAPPVLQTRAHAGASPAGWAEAAD
jgi:starch synthase